MDATPSPDQVQVLSSLKSRGFTPTVLYHVGSAPSAWFSALRHALPDAEFHLFHADSSGRLTPPDDADPRQLRVHPTPAALDATVSTLGLASPDVIKVDPSVPLDAFFDGAAATLQHAQVLFLRAPLERKLDPSALPLTDIIDFLSHQSFALSDFTQRHFDSSGRLCAVDVVFLADSLLRNLAPAATGSLAELSDRLLAMTSPPPAQPQAVRAALHDADVIVSHIEVNDRHGVGALLGKLFRDAPGVLSIRSADYHGGVQDFGDLSFRVSHGASPREAIFANVLDAFGDSTARRVLCVPYFPDDARTAIALQGIFHVPMCTYLMDDQNVCADGIPEDVMRQLLEASDLRLAISPELRVAYQQKYNLPFAYMPPVVSSALIPSYLQIPDIPSDHRHGVMVGNVWGQRWLEMLRHTVHGSGVSISWYSNGGFENLPGGSDGLRHDSIFPQPPTGDVALTRALRQSWFAVLPSGMLDDADDRRFIAQLSLPSRLIYLLATSHIPVIVLGNRETSAARFVQQFGIGVVADYTRGSFQAAVDHVLNRKVNLEMRRRALAVAGQFTDVGAAEWIWQSLERGKPLDGRFEQLMPDPLPDLKHLLDSNRRPVPVP